MKEVDGWYIPGLPDSPQPIAEQSGDAGVIDRAISYCESFRTVVQAGARVGLWPMLLAGHFERVMAFEPELENFRCCQLNCGREPRIQLMRAALWSHSGSARLVASTRSDGLHHIKPPKVLPDGFQRVETFRIDQLLLRDCDAIFLDVEGVELSALAGAADTIKRCRPVIVVEENILCRRYGHDKGDLGKYLRPLGYQLAEEYGDIKPTERFPFPGADLIFKPS